MKNLLITLLTALSISGFAQVPNAFNYQAVVRDNTGTVIPNQNVSFRISLLKGSVSGTTVYSEIHSSTTNDFGLSNLQIGNGTVASGDFSAINWAEDSYFVKIELDAAGGSNYQLMGTSQLMSVPYSNRANNSMLLQDTYNDTRVEVEKVSADNTIRFTTMDVERAVINPNGNMGIGSANPSEKLAVNGNVKADNFKYTSPKVRYFTVTGLAFSPGHSVNNSWSAYYGLGHAYLTNETGAMVAPVYLPSGAKVTNIEIFYEDTSAMDMSIRFSQHYGTGSTAIFSHSTSGESSQIQSYSSSVNHTVYNNGVAYYALLYANPWPSQAVGDRLSFQKMIITYEVNEP